MNVLVSNINKNNSSQRTLRTLRSKKSPPTVKKAYLYEGLWRPNRETKIYDDVGIPFNYPKNSTRSWKSKALFLKKLERIQKSLEKYKKFIPYPEAKDCLLCKKKSISTKLYRLLNVNWEDGYSHYIKVHNWKPTSDFIDFIYSNYIGINKKSLQDGTLFKVPSSKYTDKEKKDYIKIDKNQIMIMDALYQHGSFQKKYEDKTNNLYRFSEHAGLLQFNNGKLDKINILSTTNRTDPNDKDIFLPKNTEDAYDYSYIFHTHPATPTVGARAESGILYEFPSTSDIFHFVEHYTIGKTQGSIVVAPEGLYLIRKKKFDNKPFKDLKNITDNKNYIHKEILKIQRKAIEKYPPNDNPPPYENEYFFSTIAQDLTFIKELNKILSKFELYIEYKPRKKDESGNWIIDTMYLPIFD